MTVDEYHATYTVPDIDTLWHGGLGSFAVKASAISHQNKPTQEAIHMALKRRAAVYKSPGGYTLPIAFKIGHGRPGHVKAKPCIRVSVISPAS